VTKHQSKHPDFVRCCRQKHSSGSSENASSVAPSTLAVSPEELSRICRLIVKPVGEWLARERRLIRAIHNCVAETALICGFGCMVTFAMCFEDEYPMLWDMYGRGYIEQQASVMFNSEFPELSQPNFRSSR
jgi:hypothetical protein